MTTATKKSKKSTKIRLTKKLRNAAETYLRRRDRLEHPTGEFDSAGRWYPCKINEQQGCCDAIRSPSQAYPYSYMVHCRTMPHVAELCDVELSALRQAVKRLESE